MKTVNKSGAGTLYEANGFLIPVVAGTAHEMGAQYGALMVGAMQQAWDVVVAPAISSGALTEDDIKKWAGRAYAYGSTRTRLWYDGVAEGSGWSVERVCMLDAFNEWGVYQSKLHAFAGCTTIFSWGSQSTDGNMYIGRNMDWSTTFCQFPQVLTVRKPTDGSYKIAALGWPGMYCAYTALNEHGAYMDMHDGTSMGGQVVYEDRPSVLNILTDIISEAASKDALVARLNGTANTVSFIIGLGDNGSGESVECSSMAGNRRRPAVGDSYVVVNTFLGDSWGLGKRETVSNSLRRFSNMTDRLAETVGQVDAQKTRDLLDLRLFNEDGSFVKNGGCTKPAKQDADLTNHQMVTDVAAR
ncbi:MAG TPA: hypothetical protein DDY29_08340 [Rhodobacteraceae bacterium]|jgi:hypothetical protein|nr:hypothetical protein [Paracoccaceae bacterium]HBG98720.1 hypothetical protein [Paracoccaceae bacterium]